MGSIGFLPHLDFYMAVLGVGSGPIGLVAPLRFKTLDSQLDTSNMDPFQTDVHDFEHFPNSYGGFLTRYLSCFRPGRSQNRFSRIWVGTKKMRDEKLCRFVVVSPREVRYLTFPCPFEFLDDRSFVIVPALFVLQSPSKCTLIMSANRINQSLAITRHVRNSRADTRHQLWKLVIILV